MTFESQQGLKQTLLEAYAIDPISDETWFESSTQPKVFRKMLFGLCYFHAYVKERVQYGSLGWCTGYEFLDSDLKISAQ